jgi:hypothetical protein
MSSFLFWNIRGIGNEASVARLKRIVRKHSVSLIAILEPLVDSGDITKVVLSLGYGGALSNVSGKIWILWSKSFVIQSVFDSSQLLSVVCSSSSFPRPFLFSAVYAKCVRVDRLSLWDDILSLADFGCSASVVGGDFNVVASQAEKVGGVAVNRLSISDFNSFVVRSGLAEIPFVGSAFTWSNNQEGPNQILSRLDRVFGSADWFDLPFSYSISHLHRSCSDHAPMLLSCASRSMTGPSSFRYLSMWSSHHTYRELVADSWSAPIEGAPLGAFFRKLKRLKFRLKSWNSTVFRNIFDRVRAAEESLILAESLFDEFPSAENKANWASAQLAFSSELRIEHSYLSQKARIKWVVEGDSNSKFFHSSIRKKANLLSIREISRADLSVATTPSEVIEVIVSHFQSYLGSPSVNEPASDIMSFIPRLIHADDCVGLGSPPSSDEIRACVFALSKDSACGPDGFNGSFYRSSWDIIQSDLCLAIQHFFSGSDLPISWSSTNLILIPKCEKPRSCSEFRPISLCNFTNKIISKVLASRLSPYLDRIISSSQAGFVKGRLITDNVLLAQELVSQIDRKVRGSNVIFKLDMEKAYDRISWFFIIKVLRAFGFPEDLIDLVWRLISNCRFSVIINGSARGYFRVGRGIRQGDPLSPTLFVIAAEAFIRGIHVLSVFGQIQRFGLPSGCPLVSSLSFADDIVIFSNGNRSSVRRLLRFIHLYERCSGQLVNSSKSCFVHAKDMDPSRVSWVEAYSGYRASALPLPYLGIVLYRGRKLNALFDPLTDKVRGKIIRWNASLLSQAGRLVLIQSVLCSMGTHIFAAMTPTSSFFRSFQSLAASFFWGSKGDDRRHHWVSWNVICRPKVEGGLGLRNPKDICSAFACKLWYRFASNDSLWAKFLHAKYRRLAPAGYSGTPSFASETWKHMQSVKGLVDSHHGLSGWDGGPFSIFKAWNSTRAPSPSLPIFSRIWDSRIPPKVSLFMWRSFHGGLPVDVNLQRIGLPTVSRCRCCGHGDTESVAHLLFTGWCARACWNYFGNLLGVRGNISSAIDLLSTWWIRSTGKSLRSILYRLIPCLICWHIWCARNKAIFEDCPMDRFSVIRRVRNDVYLAFRGRPFRGSVSHRSSRFVSLLSISCSQSSDRAGIG